MELFESLKQKIKGKNISIVFPEGDDVRILGAASRLAKDGLVNPVILGAKDTVEKVAKDADIDLGNVEIIDYLNQPADQIDEMVAAIVERRKGKTDEAKARDWLKDPNYFGTTLVYMNKINGMVSGANHPTGDTVRPALQIIKTKPGVKLISGAFIMQKGDERYLFADCAINLDPDANALAEIAVESGKVAKTFDIDPKVALLSFSTKGSAKGDMVTKVQEATKLAQEQAPDMAIDGEMQFDAAFVPTVAEKKAPGSKVAGKATVFVFPELQSGNIGYKIAQRFGGFEAIGPILQGLNKPVSDLSRGSNEEDVYKVAIITAAQAL
ncbi:phosphate acetyltransferase [Lentilactobacillus buchneri]|uniref:Phosphate acetyltransferase n=1 Tax=Lentilactobacillus buchneri DSM 20057 TaxID=1423728 RepID=A0A4R5NMD5_LENBU|nr:phosphate acetyltransferase [Lentilactobacillus buchneri]WCJ51960.1 phosphate acetyltransferase [Lentilactobacillus sp. Egmn17]AEB73561.1 phosphate acetyltransferase [Lentilactobacillus buchneri NRRL B-30929]KRK69229.1 phosphate acetyltransferase [Lentilactobacillus buchneri DSM 20057]MCT2883304.1 phosphate acetyltransferase [Lentilactobacillus buchneri]MCT2898732.1 phosphate acetyltransferase [Lentilactobacillus buchneri]